jgi:D-3-phosphoglycerate dehydrogenase
VGKQVTGFLANFGAKVVISNSDADTKHAIRMLQPNIVTLHENYEPSKRGKYSHAFFSKFKGAVFVNTARGELVDEGALLAAMDAGKVAGAALDVVDGEYKPRRMLADMSKTNPHLIVTPHIAGYTHESVSKTEAMLAKKLLEEFA